MGLRYRTALATLTGMRRTLLSVLTLFTHLLALLRCQNLVNRMALLQTAQMLFSLFPLLFGNQLACFIAVKHRSF